MNAPDAQAALEAVEVGDIEVLQSLLEAEPSLVHATLEHDGFTSEMRPTLLHRANTVDSRKRRKMPAHIEAARLLIDHGADVNSTVDGCMPPLEMAIWSRNDDMVKLLLANGVDVELHREAPPVEAAVIEGKPQIFKALIAAGAKYDISHTLRLGLMRETRELLEADPELANTETTHGLPLNLAVGKPGIFKLLLRHGADIHAQDTLGLTPLKAARTPADDRLVKTLLDMGVEDDIYGTLAARDEAKVQAILKADPTLAHPIAAWPERGPFPPVTWAVFSGNTQILELILKRQVPLDFERGCPLRVAIRYRNDEMVRLLLQYGATPECADCSAWPGYDQAQTIWEGSRAWHPGLGPRGGVNRHVWVPLYEALRFGTIRAAEMLLDSGADPNSTLTNWSGLQWPARGGDLRRLKLLLDRGGDVASLCAERALHIAARECQRPTIELLVSHGVNVHSTDEAGRSAPKVVGSTDSTVSAEDKAKTMVILEELVEIAQLPKRESVRILRRRAQLIDSVIDGDVEALCELRDQEPALFERELVRHELLHHAALAGHGEVVDILVETGAPMTIQSATALGRVGLVKSMLDVDPSLLEADVPPLKIAAQKNQLEVAELLLDRGADIDRVSSFYQPTALFVAVRHLSIDVLKLLLARGADVTIRETGDHHHTPLGINWPPVGPREEIRDILVAHGANPEDQHSHNPT